MSPVVSLSDDQEPVLLGELVAAARRYPGYIAHRDDPFIEDWVLVDRDDRVIESFATCRLAQQALLAHVEDGPATAYTLRLIRVRPESEPLLHWPEPRTPLQRASDVAQTCAAGVGTKYLQATIAANFLRAGEAELRTPHGAARVIALDWPDESGTWQTVGYLHERPDGSWLLVHPHGADRPDRQAVEQAIAEAISAALSGADNVTAADVRAWCHAGGDGYGLGQGLQRELVRLALDVAERIGAIGDDEPSLP